MVRAIVWARRAKPLVFLLCALPAIDLVVRWFTDSLGAFAIEELTLATGNWAIRFLLATLLVTPLRKLTGWNWLAPYRRPLGLFAFYYVVLHLLVYLWLDHAFSALTIFLDIASSPFIIVGIVGLSSLAPLAVTSTTGWIRRLGKNWTTLHRLVWVAAIAGSLHYLLQIKFPTLQLILYAAGFLILGGYRVFAGVRRRGDKRTPRPPAQPTPA